MADRTRVLIKTDFGEFEYIDSPEVRDKVFERVMAYFKKHEAFCGESISQSDEPIIDAPLVMEDIADNIIKFNCIEMDE